MCTGKVLSSLLWCDGLGDVRHGGGLLHGVGVRDGHHGPDTLWDNYCQSMMDKKMEEQTEEGDSAV